MTRRVRGAAFMPESATRRSAAGRYAAVMPAPQTARPSTATSGMPEQARSAWCVTPQRRIASATGSRDRHRYADALKA